jgi:UDP-glucose 4-epimerase
MRDILITGGAGYIGSHAVKKFLKEGYRVIVIDNLYRGYEDALDNLKNYGDLKFYKVDLKDKDEVEKVLGIEKDIDCVLHFAALCLVNESMEKPEDYFENNVLGSLNLFEAMRKNDLKNIVFSSTCATYGDAKYLPVDEDHPQEPSNPYGESKLIVEKMLDWYQKLHGFNYVIFRYFNVCGADPDGDIGDSKKPSQLLLQNAVRGALGIEPFNLTCPKVDTPDGTPIRDYVDVNDLVEAHFLAYKYLDNKGKSGVFNLGTGKGSSVEEIVSTVEAVMKTNIARNKADPRKGEYAKVYANFNKAKDVLNWYPKTNIDNSIKYLMNWYNKYPNGFDK